MSGPYSHATSNERGQDWTGAALERYGSTTERRLFFAGLLLVTRSGSSFGSGPGESN